MKLFKSSTLSILSGENTCKVLDIIKKSTKETIPGYNGDEEDIDEDGNMIESAGNIKSNNTYHIE